MKNLFIVIILCISFGCSQSQEELNDELLNNSQSFIDNAPEIIELLKKGADANAVDKNNKRTVLINICANIECLLYKDNDERQKLVENLISNYKVNINAVDDRGMTALMHSASCGNINITKILIKNGADIKIVDKYGFTALSHVIIAPDNSNNIKTPIIELLINKDGSIINQIANNKTALDLSMEDKNQELTDFLKSKGAKTAAKLKAEKKVPQPAPDGRK